MSLRTQSSLDLREDVLQEISAEVTKLVAEYVATISGNSLIVYGLRE